MRVYYCTIGTVLSAIAVLCTASSRAATLPDANGTVHVQPFDLPESAFLSDETRAAFKHSRQRRAAEMAAQEKCPNLQTADRAQIPAIRQCQAGVTYESPWYKSLRERYDVAIAPRVIGDVYTEVFTPARGIARKNEKRVLINVHGGGFQGGSRTTSHLESIPIAWVGGIKVISIDYRMAPEYTFPAASEDVAAVYRELIKTHDPRSIGIYGCSAGATLTAHAIAWFLKEGLPLPGAVGLFCHGAPSVTDRGTSKWVASDASYIAGALSGENFENLVEPHPYYKGADRKSSLASPGDYDAIMSKFPPSLLISGMRDFTLSEVLATHAQLTRLGVPADLHVWEGMGHAFHFDPALPESREAYGVIVRFFDKRLKANT